MDGFAYFPSMVWRDERFDLVEKVMSFCMNRLEEVRKRQNSNFLQTENLFYEPSMRELSNYILLSSVNILRWQNYDVDKYDFYLSGLWAQETNKSSGTNVHVHKNSQISGWFFLQTPERGSFPIFHDTRMNKLMVELDVVQSEEVTNATSTVIFNNIKPGTVIFNNSWMQHQLSVNDSDLPSRCIHFIVSHKERNNFTENNYATCTNAVFESN